MRSGCTFIALFTLVAQCTAVAGCTVRFKPPPDGEPGPSLPTGEGGGEGANDADEESPNEGGDEGGSGFENGDEGAGDFGPGESDQPRVARSWATFTAFQGADGPLLDGVAQPDWTLPAFAHRGSLFPGASRVSVEAVVTYLPAGAEAVSHQVSLGLASNGGFDAWFPDAVVEGMGERLHWTATARPSGSPPALEGDGGPWQGARGMGASPLISSGQEVERFLFARGQADFGAPLHVKSTGNDNYLLTNRTEEVIDHALLLRKHVGGWLIWPLSAIPPGESPLLRPPPKERFAREKVTDALEDLVSAAGLSQVEQRAILEVWGDRWTDAEGARVVFVAPPQWTESVMPLTVDGASVSRVLLGRLEVFPVDLESKLMEDLSRASERQDEFDVGGLPRFVVPKLNRCRNLALEGGEEALAEYCDRLSAARSGTD